MRLRKLPWLKHAFGESGGACDSCASKRFPQSPEPAARIPTEAPILALDICSRDERVLTGGAGAQGALAAPRVWLVLC